MGRDQETADLLLKIMPNDMDLILSEEKTHGACLRLNQGKKENEWIFTDGHKLITPVHTTE
jgi:hypothetical protein